MAGKNRESLISEGSRLPFSFTQKYLRITLTVAQGGLGKDSAFDTVVLEGYRAQVEVTLAGLNVGRTCNARIYGLTLPLMNRLSLLAFPINARASDAIRTTRNTIMVEAGDSKRGFSTLYYGMVTEAFADFSSVPEPAFQIYSGVMQAPNVAIVPFRSYPAGTAVAEIISMIASEAGYGFVNYGVNARIIRAIYLSGSLANQIEQLRAETLFIYDIRSGGVRENEREHQQIRHEVALWPRDLADMKATTLPYVSAKTGLIGYPSYSASGVVLTTLYDPRISFMGPIRVDSQFLPDAWANNSAGQIAPMPVNGTWLPNFITHELDSEISNGRWFTRIEATRADIFGKLPGSKEEAG